jgi:phage terminase large subunit
MSEPLTLRSKCSDTFEPLNSPARWKAAHGGRGSGKSYFFAEKLVLECMREDGTRAVCIRQFQRSLKQSSKHIIESKIAQLQLEPYFTVQVDKILTPGGGAILFEGMQNHNAHSIKSLEDCRIAWVDEAQTLTAHSLELLRPTIRVPGSELWFSYNRTRKNDAVDEFFRRAVEIGEDAVLVQSNWRNNPWWNDALEKERTTELRLYPERYDHVYEGDYARSFAGAYFQRHLAEARREGRISKVARDPLLPIKSWWDLGGAGAQADAMAIWIGQVVGHQIRLLDYIEGVGQPLAFYTELLRSRGWAKCICILPHDGMTTNAVTGNRYWQHLAQAEFDVPAPIENQGPGAAMMRIESARRVFPKVWFNEDTTEAGRDALGYYHERRHEERNVGLGPEHDWSSHAADAFGLMAIVYEEPHVKHERKRPRMAGGWMSA